MAEGWVGAGIFPCRLTGAISLHLRALERRSSPDKKYSIHSKNGCQEDACAPRMVVIARFLEMLANANADLHGLVFYDKCSMNHKRRPALAIICFEKFVVSLPRPAA